MGFYIEPTIISDVTTSMQIWREEVFGPVLCVKTFSSEDEAIELANDTQWVDLFVWKLSFIWEPVWVVFLAFFFWFIQQQCGYLSQLWLSGCCNFKWSGEVWTCVKGEILLYLYHE